MSNKCLKLKEEKYIKKVNKRITENGWIRLIDLYFFEGNRTRII